MNTFENCRVEIERLRSQHSIYQKEYSEVSTRNFIGVLRNWTEVGASESALFNSEFSVPRVLKKFRRNFRRTEYIYAFFSSKPTSYATKNILIAGPWEDGHDDGVGSGVTAKKNAADGSISFSSFFYADSKMDSSKMSSINNCIKQLEFNKVDLLAFLNSPAIYYCFEGDDSKSVSVRGLISEVANGVGRGAHPFGKEEVKAYTNSVNKMMKYRIGDIPLPYFCLLNISNQILHNFKSE